MTDENISHIVERLTVMRTQLKLHPLDDEIVSLAELVDDSQGRKVLYTATYISNGSFYLTKTYNTCFIYGDDVEGEKRELLDKADKELNPLKERFLRALSEAFGVETIDHKVVSMAIIYRDEDSFIIDSKDQVKYQYMNRFSDRDFGETEDKITRTVEKYVEDRSNNENMTTLCLFPKLRTYLSSVRMQGITMGGSQHEEKEELDPQYIPKMNSTFQELNAWFEAVLVKINSN